MKDPKEETGRVNRDGITQGSGYGDTQAKARDAEDTTKNDDYDRAREEQPKNQSSTDDLQSGKDR